MAKKENTQEIGFEQQIWKAADKLRGNLDASEYKSVVLGLIFLKYISDKFEERYLELTKASFSCLLRHAGQRLQHRLIRRRLAR